jgi:hypothetical protein
MIVEDRFRPQAALAVVVPPPVRRRGDDAVDGAARDLRQHVAAVAVDERVPGGRIEPVRDLDGLNYAVRSTGWRSRSTVCG